MHVALTYVESVICSGPVAAGCSPTMTVVQCWVDVGGASKPSRVRVFHEAEPEKQVLLWKR